MGKIWSGPSKDMSTKKFVGYNFVGVSAWPFDISAL